MTARRAFAVVCTGALRADGNLLLASGVVAAGAVRG